MTPDGFRRATGVSRETLARLEAYVVLLKTWQRAVNLVSARSLADVWRRHLLDAAQVFPHLPVPCRRLVDLGSGAGFPGMVLAVLGAEGVELVESDSRKCAFLAEVARATGAPVTIHCRRVDELPAAPADAITARALAPLPRLLALSSRFLGPHTRCLFLKGARAGDELTQAGRGWRMRVVRIPSLSDPTGTLLQIDGITRERAR
ncbi:MAG: 16S rRNA (guanine(527)-N(7))-methyltransferase RsmG [Alphaproteobacteria bacterium]